jgi:hypothetical protein
VGSEEPDILFIQAGNLGTEFRGDIRIYDHDELVRRWALAFP